MSDTPVNEQTSPSNTFNHGYDEAMAAETRDALDFLTDQFRSEQQAKSTNGGENSVGDSLQRMTIGAAKDGTAVSPEAARRLVHTRNGQVVSEGSGQDDPEVTSVLPSQGLNSIQDPNVTGDILNTIAAQVHHNSMIDLRKEARDIVKSFKKRYTKVNNSSLDPLYDDWYDWKKDKEKKTMWDWAKEIYTSFAKLRGKDQRAKRLDSYRKTALDVVYDLVDAWDTWANQDKLRFKIFEEAVFDVFEKGPLDYILTICVPMDKANALYNMDNRKEAAKSGCKLVIGMPWYCKYHLKKDEGQMDPVFEEECPEVHTKFKAYFDSYKGAGHYKGYGSSTMNRRLYRVLFNPTLGFQNDPFFRKLSMPSEVVLKPVESQPSLEEMAPIGTPSDSHPDGGTTGADLRTLKRTNPEMLLYPSSCSTAKKCQIGQEAVKQLVLNLRATKQFRMVDSQQVSDQGLNLVQFVEEAWEHLKTHNVRVFKPRITGGHVNGHDFAKMRFDEITHDDELVCNALHNTIDHWTRPNKDNTHPKNKRSRKLDARGD